MNNNNSIIIITVREAVREDVNSITEFQMEMARETENRELNRDTVLKGVKSIFDFAPHRGFYVVAVDDSSKVVVGSLLITYEWSDWNAKFYWYFQSVFITPKYRRRGIFTKLFHYITQLAKERDAAALRLYVDQYNESAQATYEKLGMEVRSITYNNDDNDND